MFKEPVDFLKHIADECEYLLSVNKDLLKSDFLEDETLKRAVVRSLEIIGEATKKIPQTLKLNGVQSSGRIWQVCETALFTITLE